MTRSRRFGVAATWLAGAVALPLPGARAEEGEDAQLRLRPSLEISTVADDNPAFADDAADWGAGAWLYPRLELSYGTPAIEVGANVGAELRRALAGSSLDAEHYHVSGFAEAGLLPGLSVRISDAFVPKPRWLGLPSDDSRNLLQTHRSDLAIRFWRELPAARELEVGVVGTYFTSETFAAVVATPGGGTAVDPNFRADFGQGAAFLELQSPLGRHTSATLLSQVGYRSFADAARSDHVNASVLMGLRSRRFGRAQIDVAVGYGLLAFEAHDNEHALLGNASLRVQLSPSWSGFISLANEFSSNLAGNEVVQASGRAGLESYFGERTGASISAFVSRFEDPALNRDESVYGGAELELWRALTRHTRLSLAYRYWRNGGDAAVDDFDQNRVVLQFRYQL
jgi:hypothetical protein